LGTCWNFVRFLYRRVRGALGARGASVTAAIDPCSAPVTVVLVIFPLLLVHTSDPEILERHLTPTALGGLDHDPPALAVQ
jgi:hypothetical protein